MQGTPRRHPVTAACSFVQLLQVQENVLGYSGEGGEAVEHSVKLILIITMREKEEGFG